MFFKYRLRASLTLFSLLLTLPLFTITPAMAQQGHAYGVFKHSDHAVAPPLRDTVPLPEKEGHREKPIHLLLTPATRSPKPDGALQTLATSAASVGNITGFDGLGVGGGYTPNAAPPDTNGAVGATQYVQWVNESFAVYNKSTGAMVYGPAAGNTLFQALGSTHQCAVNNDGDPIAQYDKAAGRWVLTQFSVTNGATKGYWQCVAVSTTSDATGSYHVYAFKYTNFNDYPKLGVWKDGYYITYNMFNGNTFVGSELCAFDRNAMLAGTAANEVCFQLSSNYGGVLPADIDGTTTPPAGAPEYFVNFGTNALNVWTISNVNFTAQTATLAGPSSIPVASFSPACSGGGTCIPQTGTTQKLDSLADRMMYRLAYRNFGDHQSLVTNHTVTAGTASGVRWYELRASGSSVSLYQQGTYAPDSSYRWMGSAAMDQTSNIAVGYSVSSSSLNPAIRFAGRASGDPLGTLGSELNIKTGTGSQNGSLSRWGDYSSISVDPADDCTMWYTTEYIQTTGSYNWSTRIANFKFSNCGAVQTPDYSISATPASQSVSQGGGTSYTATVTPSNGFTGVVNFSISGLPTGASASFNPTSVTTSGSSTLTVNTTTSTPAGTYSLTITGTSGTLSHTATVTLVVSVPDFTLTASPTSKSIAQGSSGTVTVSSSVSGGFNSAVSLSASGAPSGVTVSFNPTSFAAPGSGSSTMTIAVASTAATGSSTITITATGGSITHTATVSLTVTSANQQLLGNPGFENGSASPAPWVPTAGVIDSSTSEPAHSGSWKAWLDGYGSTHTDTLYQQVSIPSTATSATLTFWLHIDTAETTTTTAYDTLQVQVRNSAGTLLGTLATYSNLNKASGYTQKSFDLTSWKGQTIRVHFVGSEDSSLQTSFVIDDTALNVQ